MITRHDHPAKHNPIPAHLQIQVRSDVEFENRALAILESLQTRVFDASQSRVLVFCTSRKDTEEQASLFSQLASQSHEEVKRVGSFHAGMSKEDRDETYERYKSGDISVLFATKAFGMGMDVPNIHYVFHLKPSSSLEDYLQEIGRAGRHKASREQAGFSSARPIVCVLFAKPDDFKRTKDWLHKSHLAWVELPRVQNAIEQYAKRIGALAEPESKDGPLEVKMKPFPLPLNLIEQSDEFQDAVNPESVQSMGLYWLEKLRRIKLGHYLPAYLEFENRTPDPIPVEDPKIQALCECIATEHNKAVVGESTLLLSSAQLFRALEVRQLPDLIQVVVKAQRQKLVTLLYKLNLKITNKRSDEIAKWVSSQHEQLPPFLVASYEMASSILRSIRGDQALELNMDWLSEESRRIAATFFEPVDESPESVKKAEKEKKDFLRPSRAKSIMTLIRECPGILLRSDLEDTGVVYRIRNDSREWNRPTPLLKRQDAYLAEHQSLAVKSLAYIQERQIGNVRIELAQMMIDLQVPRDDIQLLEKVLLHLRWMGYIKMGSLLPMAIELYLLPTRPIDEDDKQGVDYKIFKQYEENRRLKTLRLASLQTLAELDKTDLHRRFIVAYFKTKSAAEVLDLIEHTLLSVNAQHPLLRQLREVAFKEMEASLSEDQKAVYEAQNTQSVMVIAGPGSGKTHTLLMRLARLIHKSNVDPASILVLAYNRAVIVEIRHRLSELLGKLGYSSLVSSLHIFTFYGLIRYCLPEETRELDFNNENGSDPWVEKFLQVAENEPGKITKRIDPGSLRYLFVDEYQDISPARYLMLRWLAQSHCKTTIIGDPDQSIYGYERTKAGTPTSAADPFFKTFKEDFEAATFSLGINFRSYAGILHTAQILIDQNKNRQLTALQVASRIPKPGWKDEHTYVETVNGNYTEWIPRLRELLLEKNDNQGLHRSIAVFFRSGAEVYEAFQQVREHLGKMLDEQHISLTLQGNSSSLHRHRVYASVLAHIRKIQVQQEQTHGADNLSQDLLHQMIERLSSYEWPATWDVQAIQISLALLRSYALEKSNKMTYGELFNFFRNAIQKDQGQLQKLVQMNIGTGDGALALSRRNVVISTFHKVKGLEFDAVIVPQSNAPFPFAAYSNNISDADLIELLEEERRIYYVGYTRARNRLLKFKGPREEAIEAGRMFDASQECSGRTPGLLFDGDPFDGRQILFKPANRWFIREISGLGSEMAFFDYLHNTVRIGDPLRIVLHNNGHWFIEHEKYLVGQLSNYKGALVESWHRRHQIANCTAMKGLVITEIVRHTADESRAYDRQHDRSYTNNWSRYFLKKGYAYIINFAGYARPVMK